PLNGLMILIGCGFALALAGLVFLEQLYRNSGSDVRWTVKFLCLGLGGLFAYDIYVFASGLLFLRLDNELWAARGAVNALAVPLIAVSVARSAKLKRRRYVSRRVVFYTSTLLGVGTYLIIMAAGGYAVRAYGGSWGSFAQILFLSGALFVLAVVLFSGQARARVKVFLTKHFLDFRYDYREEWLKLTRALTATDNEKPLAVRAIEAVTGLLDSPGGALWLRDEKTYTVSHAWNLALAEDAEVPADSPFLRFMDEREWIIDLEQLRTAPGHYDDLEMPQWLAGIADAGVVLPLKQSDGLLGFMVLARALAPRELTFEDHDLLKTVGRQIAGHLALDRDVLKFRSMTVDAERDGVAQWAQKNDARVTRVGAVIRKYRLDELPQIFNVLRNDMSFVGPRPERPSFVEELSEQIPYYSERHCVKPGITGWAQLCYEYGSSMEDAMEKLQYDLFYVKNRTLLFDLMVMLQTAEVVLWKAGAR
ncbi:MAG: XrtA/PEP-CTERM system histidine kinase PrsK, partial [Pseudomonadota bacterium]